MSKSISYAITVKNELKEIKILLNYLIKNIKEEDEIVILQDSIDVDTRIHPDIKKTHDWIKKKLKDVPNSHFEMKPLNRNFAGFKNYLSDICTKDYIFNIDADEVPHWFLIANIKSILETNPTVDLFWVPRINKVEGLDPKYIKLWSWDINEKGWINFPDYQQRIWKRVKSIFWFGEVHERLIGYQKCVYLPKEENYSFYHYKDAERQIKQNEFYSTIQKNVNPETSKIRIV